MQLNIQELIALAGTLPPQFADMQLEHKGPARQIVQPQLAGVPSSPEQDTKRDAIVQAVVPQHQTERERMVLALAKEYRGNSLAELQGKLGSALGAEVANALRSQVPTLKQILGKRQQMRRAADAECGQAMAMAGIRVQQHSTKDYAHVIVTQLDMLQDGAIPSVSTVVNAAFPDDPKKATSIKNSENGKRRKQAWDSHAVVNHPMEIAMQATHGRGSMNRRLTARTFGQCLSMNAALFKSCDRITKLEARVQLLEQQMQATKQREALADAGATSSRDKVLALSDQGKKPTEIAKQLDMPRNTVRSIIRRSKNL